MLLLESKNYRQQQFVATAKLALLWKILRIFKRSFVLGVFSVKFIAAATSCGTLSASVPDFIIQEPIATEIKLKFLNILLEILLHFGGTLLIAFSSHHWLR